MNGKNILLALAFVGLTTVSLNVGLKPAHAQGSPTQGKQQHQQEGTHSKKSHANQSSQQPSAQNNEQKDSCHNKSRTNQSSQQPSAQQQSQENDD